MKKTLTIVLAISIILVSFASCKNKNVQVKTSSSSNSSQGTQKDGGYKYKPVDVDLLLWDEENRSTAGADWTRQRQDMFSEQYPEIHIKRTMIPQQTSVGAVSADRIAFVTAMASGSAPTAYQGAYFSVMQQWVDQDFAYPIDEYLSSFDDFKDITKNAISAAQSNGKTYGIPVYIYALNFAYRKDLYKKAGLDPNIPPKTWDELIKYSQMLTKSDKSQYGLALIGSLFPDWWYQIFVWQAGGELVVQKANKTLELQYTSEAAKTALQFYKDLKWKYNVLQPDATTSHDALIKDFAMGKAAQIIYTTQNYENTKALGLEDKNLGLAPLPVGPSGEKVTANGGAYWIINKSASAEQRAAAFEYIKFMTSKESQIEYYKALESNGARAPMASFYNDVNVSDYINFSDEWGKALDEALKSARPETLLVEKLRPYLAPAIEMVMVDKNENIDSLLSQTQKNANNDVINAYNKNLK